MCETKLIWAMGPLLYAPKVAYVCSHHEACLQEVVCCASDVSFNVKNTWHMHQPSKKRSGVPTSFRCNSHLESSQPGPQRLNPSIPITPLPGRCIICTWQCLASKDAWLGTKESGNGPALGAECPGLDANSKLRMPKVQCVPHLWASKRALSLGGSETYKFLPNEHLFQGTHVYVTMEVPGIYTHINIYHKIVYACPSAIACSH